MRAYDGGKNVVEVLLEKGAYVEKKDVLGYSCLDVGKDNKNYKAIKNGGKLRTIW